MWLGRWHPQGGSTLTTSCFYISDAPGEHGCHRNQSHRPVAQALWHSSALGVTLPPWAAAIGWPTHQDTPGLQCSLISAGEQRLFNRRFPDFCGSRVQCMIALDVWAPVAGWLHPLRGHPDPAWRHCSLTGESGTIWAGSQHLRSFRLRYPDPTLSFPSDGACPLHVGKTEHLET